ncbi:MAG: capsule biosynthesis protein, partial [Pseudomonadota bacterium]
MRRSTDAPGAPSDDGFGDTAFPGSAKSAEDSAAREAGIAEVRREGLTGRQLRMARRLAQKHGLDATSDFDAVRLLRAKGIDPFDRANMLELVAPKTEPAPRPAQPPQQQPPKAMPLARIKKKTVAQAAPSAPAQAASAEPKPMLPQTVDETQQKLPGEHRPDAGYLSSEMERIQRDIVRRRRRNLTFLFARLALFVLLPTFVAWFYFAFVATPGYTTMSAFEVQQAEGSAVGGGGGLGGMMTSNTDSIKVQEFLTSREALQMLEADHGYRAHFSGGNVDFWQRVPSGASNEELYEHFAKRVEVGFDTTEGLLRMEVTALSPEASQTFSEALIGYAEERVDQSTERKRQGQMSDVEASFA